MKRNVFFFFMLVTCLGLSAQGISTKKTKIKQSSAKTVLNSKGKNLQPNKTAVSISEKNSLKSQFSNSKVQKLISSKTLKSGINYNVYQMTDGRLVKRIENANRTKSNKLSIKKKDYIRTEAQSAEATFFEDFEGWDGITRDWIPSGWFDDSKTGSLTHTTNDGKGYNYTWSTTESSFTATYEGNYMAMVHWPTTYDDPEGNLDEEGNPIQILPNAQDEWLITPAITLAENNKLYFSMAYSPGWMLINQDTFSEFDSENQYIEVYIQKNSETNWTKVWSAIDDARTYTEDELWEDVMAWGQSWRTFKVDISQYVGQEIKVAFRYANPDPLKAGESVYLDAVKIGTPEPQALYARPDGYFYLGFSEDYSATNAMIGPAYEDAMWYNYSNFDSETFEWYFENVDDPNSEIVLEDINPTIQYPFARIAAPLLVASAVGAKEDSYYATWDDGFIHIGGNTNVIFQEDTELTTLGAGNYDVNLGFTLGMTQSGGYVFGTNNEDFWGEGVKLDGIGNYFEKPLHTYMFSKVWVNCGMFQADADAELTLTIYRIDEEGNFKDIIASSVCYGKDVIYSHTSQGFTYHSIPFVFTETDPETGEKVEVYIETGDAIFMELTGFTDGKVKSIAPFFQSDNSPTGESNGYVYLTIDGEATLLNISDALLDTYSSFLFNMDVTYPFMVTDNDKYEAPTTGGAYDFQINSYWINTDMWWLEEEIPEWITLGDISLDPETEVVTLPITVKPLPDGTKGRKFDIKLVSLASNLTLTVTQGEVSGISEDKVDMGVKVINNNTYFTLNYGDQVKSVEVYNTIGKKVTQVALPSTGTYDLQTAGLSSGIYLLKFTGDNQFQTVKAIKK